MERGSSYQSFTPKRRKLDHSSDERDPYEEDHLSNAPASNTSPSYPKTYRVRGLPFHYTVHQAQILLQSVLALDVTTSVVRVRSLAVGTNLRYQVATVDIDGTIPGPLVGRHERTFDVSHISSGSEIFNPQDENVIPKALQITIDDHFHGFTVLHSFADDADHKIDCISISGLGGHAFGSFKERGGSHMWLRDSLPWDLPGARMLVYGYSTKLPDSSSFQDLEALATAFRESLEAARSAPTVEYSSSIIRKPLILIAHSLGGLVVKQALIQMSRSTDLDKTMLNSIRGVLFFGVPSRGMDIESLIPMVRDQANQALLHSLGKESQLLRDQSRAFPKAFASPDSELVCFYETLTSPTAERHGTGWKMTGARRILVDSSSATCGRPWEAEAHHAQALDRQHSDLVKFKVHDVDYERVLAVLRRLIYIVRSTSTGGKLGHDAEQRQKYMNSLRFDHIDARHATIKTAYGKTCQWLLVRSEYKDWLDVTKLPEHHGFFWIKGKAGTGKSTLMKLAYTNAKQSMTDNTVICFFFNARGEHLERSTLGLYRSLLFQVMEKLPDLQSLFDSLASGAPSDQEAFRSWTTETVKELFAYAIENLGHRCLVCFIDALDECEEDQVREMVAFFEQLGELAISSQIRLHICFSSRHYPHITIDKGIQLALEGQRGHEDDIANYLHSKLKAGGSTLIQKIKGEVLERASGIFLWVVLVVDMLNKEYDHGRIHALRKRLDEIPDDLDELFIDILTRDSAHMNEMFLCLQWILYARRSLKPEELYFAIMAGEGSSAKTPWDPEETAQEDMQRFILNSSKGLAEVTKSKTPTVQFIHDTVREFLLIGSGHRWLQTQLGTNIPGLSHGQLSQCCQNQMKINTSEYLPFQTLSSTQSVEAANPRQQALTLFPFLGYAVHNVLHHADAACGHEISQDGFLDDFHLREWINLDNYMEIYSIRKHTSDCSLLYILAEQNLPNLIRTELKRVPNMDIKGERYGFPLLAAVACENESVLEALLTPSGSAWTVRDKPIHTSSSSTVNDPKEATKYLLERRYELNKNPEHSSWNGQTGLSVAAAWGVIGLVKTLLATQKVDVNAKDGALRTPLSWAAGNGYEAMVKLLVSRADVEVDSRDQEGRSPLSWAAGNGHEAVVKLLVNQADVEVDSRPQEGRSPLSWAAGNGHEAVVKLLVNRADVEVNSQSLGGLTPLSFATNNGHEAVVKLLVDRADVEIGSRAQRINTPLTFAAINGHEAVVKLLVDRADVEVNLRDDSGRTALWYAAERGREAIVRLLLSRGDIDVSLIDKNGGTALLCAQERGHAAVVEVLRSYIARSEALVGTIRSPI